MCALAYSTVFHGLLTLCAPALGQLVHMGEHAHLTIIVIALVSLGHGGATLRFLLSVSAVLRCACCRHTAVGCTHIRQIRQAVCWRGHYAWAGKTLAGTLWCGVPACVVCHEPTRVESVMTKAGGHRVCRPCNRRGRTSRPMRMLYIHAYTPALAHRSRPRLHYRLLTLCPAAD